jgi:hypothetical protein
MTSPLLGSLAATIGSAMSSLFLDATLTRDVPGTIVDPADPPLPTQITYSCKAIEQEYSAGLRGQGLVGATDIQVLILASTITVEPQPLDRITIRGKTVTIVPMSAAGMKAVQSDPAKATWSCRCRS